MTDIDDLNCWVWSFGMQRIIQPLDELAWTVRGEFDCWVSVSACGLTYLFVCCIVACVCGCVLECEVV